nr:MAG TPA: hypothetical protein [Caudoviricetes sp.]
MESPGDSPGYWLIRSIRAVVTTSFPSRSYLTSSFLSAIIHLLSRDLKMWYNSQFRHGSYGIHTVIGAVHVIVKSVLIIIIRNGIIRPFPHIKEIEFLTRCECDCLWQKIICLSVPRLWSKIDFSGNHISNIIPHIQNHIVLGLFPVLLDDSRTVRHDIYIMQNSRVPHIPQTALISVENRHCIGIHSTLPLYSSLLNLFHSSENFSQPYIATNATMNPAIIAARIMYHKIACRMYCIYAINTTTVNPMERTNTRMSVGILERKLTPLNTCVIKDTRNASIPIIVNSCAMLVIAISMLHLPQINIFHNCPCFKNCNIVSHCLNLHIVSASRTCRLKIEFSCIPLFKHSL